MADRGTARVVGGLFIVGTVAGGMGLAVSRPLVDSSDFLTDLAAHDDKVATAALLTLVMGVALAGMSIVIFPVLRRHNTRLAVGYVVARAVESMFYVIDAVLLLTLVTVSRSYVGSDGEHVSGLRSLGDALLGARDWSAAILDATAFGVSAVMLNLALHSARLVPRWLSAWGLAGAVLYIAAGVLVLYGLEPLSTTQVVLQVPLGVQELALGLWLIVRGFAAPAAASERGADRGGDLR